MLLWSLMNMCWCYVYATPSRLTVMFGAYVSRIKRKSLIISLFLTWHCFCIHLYVTICMKLDPGMHIGMHLVFFGKAGVTISHWTKSFNSPSAKGHARLPTSPRHHLLLPGQQLLLALLLRPSFRSRASPRIGGTVRQRRRAREEEDERSQVCVVISSISHLCLPLCDLSCVTQLADCFIYLHVYLPSSGRALGYWLDHSMKCTSRGFDSLPLRLGRRAFSKGVKWLEEQKS
jgi:hypothetical protein